MPEMFKVRTVRLLRWSERYTNLDMVYFASGSFWQTFGQAGSSFLALGLLLVFANFLPKETYGTYRYLISLAAILNVFTLTGMSQAVAQAVANGRDGVLRTAVRYQIKWNLLLMVASWALGAYYLWHENFAYGGALLVLSLCLPLTNAFNTYGPYLAAKRDFKLNNLFSILSTLIYVLGMFAAIFISGQVIWLVVAYALTTLAANALFYFLTLRMFKPPQEPAEDVLKYGRHLTYIGLMKPIVSQLDSIILNHFWGAAPLAVYSIAVAIPNRAVPFIKDWVDLGFPKVAVKTPEDIDRTFYQRIAQGLFIGAVFAALYALAAPLLFKYLLPQYLDAVLYTQILAVTFIFAMPNRYVSTLLASQKMSKRIFTNSITISGVQLLLYAVLGIWGGILGLIVAQVLNGFIGLMINIASWRFART
ncbi:MAG: oligosaccharide flippase family protein [Patescibacteria group bacterium]